MEEEEEELEVTGEGEKSKSVDVDFNGGGGGHGGGRSGGGGKVARLPRWTRQEILVLIQGKRVAENRVKRGRVNCGESSSHDHNNEGGVAVQMEPKWATVSSYCKRHGVNRGPVQCRKRWSNLAGDFKKIKEWENHIKDEGESFWLMRNDFRRERKLPGFFDREVFDILNNSISNNHTHTKDGNHHNNTNNINGRGDGDGDGDQLHDAVFDSGRSAAANDGLFSDFEQPTQQQQQQEVVVQVGQQQRQQPLESPTIPVAIPAPTPISEKQYRPPTAAEATDPGTSHEKHQQEDLNPEMGSTSREGRRKRRRFSDQEDNNNNNGDNDQGGPLQDQLIQVLEKNGRIISSQLDAYNINLKLDREERKDHATSLVAVLNKLADSLGRIADKL